MREILFRGKKKATGAWVDGNYYKQELFYGDLHETHFIITSNEDLEYDQALDAYEVYPATVGQYTGLNDKNGKRIFEGDILTIARTSDGIGTYFSPAIECPVKVVVRWDMCAWMWETIAKDKRYISFPSAWCYYECEVIGNIHDNPELIGGGES